MVFILLQDVINKNHYLLFVLLITDRFDLTSFYISSKFFPLRTFDGYYISIYKPANAFHMVFIRFTLNIIRVPNNNFTLL